MTKTDDGHLELAMLFLARSAYEMRKARHHAKIARLSEREFAKRVKIAVRDAANDTLNILKH